MRGTRSRGLYPIFTWHFPLCKSQLVGGNALQSLILQGFAAVGCEWERVRWKNKNVNHSPTLLSPPLLCSTFRGQRSRNDFACVKHFTLFYVNSLSSECQLDILKVSSWHKWFTRHTWVRCVKWVSSKKKGGRWWHAWVRCYTILFAICQVFFVKFFLIIF